MAQQRSFQVISGDKLDPGFDFPSILIAAWNAGNWLGCDP